MVNSKTTSAAEVLVQLGLANYAEDFELRGISTTEDLKSLSDENVAELVVDDNLERTKLRAWIHQANRQSSSTAITANYGGDERETDETLPLSRDAESVMQRPDCDGDGLEWERMTILEKIKHVLEGQGWSFQEDADRNVIVCGASGENGDYRVLFFANEQRRTMGVYYLSNIKVPQKLRHEAAEFVTRANYGITIGNFEMDFDDGEVRYKASIDVEGGVLAPRMIESLIAASGVTMDRYFPGLMAVCYAGKEASVAVKEIEDPSDGEAAQ